MINTIFGAILLYSQSKHKTMFILDILLLLLFPLLTTFKIGPATAAHAPAIITTDHPPARIIKW